MKVYSWQDDDGFIRRVLARESDTLASAKEVGIPIDPPNLEQVDWNEVKRKLHNLLAQRDLYDWSDLERAPHGTLESAILAVLKPQIVYLYKQTRRGGI